MALNDKEKTIAMIANAIAVFSIKHENKTIPESVSLIDFILKTIPPELKGKVSMELVDNVFEYVSGAHSS